MIEALDLFAGAGGWDVAANDLGFDPLGVEIDADAVATRWAVGFRTLAADVFALEPEDFGPIDGLIGSPPCQAFSVIRDGLGRRDVERIVECMEALGRGVDRRRELRDEVVPSPGGDGQMFGFATADTRSLLVVEPLRFALALRPRWIALEQVPPVLPVWGAMARVLREAGYGAWSGLLRSDEYGVPQTRERAFLLARLGRPALPPAPTHQRWTRGRMARFPHDLEGRLPWTTIGSALTLEEFPFKLRATEQENATERSIDEPAPTVTPGHAVFPVWVDGSGRTVEQLTIEQVAALQGFPSVFPWEGTRSSIVKQIGNAVPPPMARAILADLTNEGGGA